MVKDQTIKIIRLVHSRLVAIKIVNLSPILNKVTHNLKRLKEKRKSNKLRILLINQVFSSNKKYNFQFKKKTRVYSSQGTFLDSLEIKNLLMDYLVEIGMKEKRRLDQQQDNFNQTIIHSKII